MDDEITEGIYLENAYPMLDEDGMQTKSYVFTLKNSGSITSYYTIYFDDINIELLDKYDRMNPNFVKYYLLKNNSDDSSGIISNIGTSPNRILDQGIITPGTTNTYELKLWISEDATEEVEDTIFAAKLRVEAEQNNMYPHKVTVSMPSNTQNERNFTWHTVNSDLASDVQIVKAISDNKSLSIFENSLNVLEYEGTNVTKTLDLYVHQAKATNLEAGTKYYYRVGDKSKNIWSDIGEFITDNGDDSFSFIYVADQQTSSSAASKSIYTMKQAMSKVKSSEFILNAGDLLNNPTSKNEWLSNLSFSVYGNMTTINTAGNHDYSYNGELAHALKNHFYHDLPSDIDTEKGMYYSLNYGNTHITILNTNSYWYGRLDEAQLEWLKNDLATSQNATFRIVLMHRGMYTTGPHYYHYQDIQTLTNQLTSVMADYNVDLVIQGHDHTYALTYPINNNGDAETITTSSLYSNELNKNINAMKNNSSPVYFIGGTAGTKYEPQLIKDGNSYIVDPTSNKTSYSVKPDTTTLNSYFSKFQKTETPKKNDETRLAMFSSISINGNKLIVNSYTVDNQNYGEVKLYNSFGLTK